MRGNVIGALGAVLLCSCGARQKAPNEPRGNEPYVEEVDVVGNEAFSDDALVGGLGSREPRGWIRRRRTRFDPAVVEKDRARIEAYYKRRGFFDAFVDDVKTERDDREVALTFLVREGPPSRVAAIEIDGLPDGSPVTAADLAGQVEIAVGSRFDYGDYDAGKRKVLVALLERGYAHARVEGRAEADRERREVTLRYTVDPGPVVEVGAIAVKGLRDLPESVVRNRLALHTGDVFHPRAVARSQHRIRSVGRFGVVRVEFADEARKPVSDVDVTVSEGPRQEVRLGGGVGIDQTQYEVRGRAGYTLHGFLQPLITLTADFRPALAVLPGAASDQGINFVPEIGATLTRPDLFLPLVTGSASLDFSRQVLEAYTSDGTRVRIGLSRPLWRDRVHLSAGWRYNLVGFENVDAAIEMTPGLEQRLGLDDEYLLGSFDQVISLDLRDNPLNARNGVYVDVRLQEAGPFAGGEFSFVRFVSEARGFYALSERLGLAAKVRFGQAVVGTLPITERFFGGGASSQRGFSQRQLSPNAVFTPDGGDTVDTPFGGEQLVETSGEIRFGIVKLGGNYLGIVGFVDAADVVDEGDSVDLANLHVATGGGLRYQTPVGPIRFDVGYRLNRFGAGQLQPNNRWAFHLSIGEAF